jgi:A/G-specific adenine glycosylase
MNQPVAHTKPNLESAQVLVAWYNGVKRVLPWRINRDPYRIWVSEVMLQQTTVAAVVPYYERFMARFPNIKSLAKAPQVDVLEHWAGLGYYSRARNLHKAAQELAASGFPKSFSDLIKLPGFGPYTARAVASLAFGEKTGVLDGNVIRVLSRRYGLKLEWWKPPARTVLQEIVDRLAQVDDSSSLNQGLMELGATVCTPKSPACVLCPWVKECRARLENQISELPLKRPRREREIWQWRPKVIERRGSIMLVPNTYAPFLKGHWILPGEAALVRKAPKGFDYKGTVTHHDIFVSVSSAIVSSSAGASKKGKDIKWVKLDQLPREIPASLIRKAIVIGLKDRPKKRALS